MLDFKTLFLFLALFTHFYKHYNKPRFAKELRLKNNYVIHKRHILPTL